MGRVFAAGGEKRGNNTTGSSSSAFRPWLPWLVMLLSILASVMLWHQINISYQARNQQLFSARAQELKQRFLSMSASHERLILSCAALFQASDKVTGLEWQMFFSSMPLTDYYPGIVSVGFAPYITGDSKNAIIEELLGSTIDNVRIWPDSNLDVSVPVIMISPETEWSKRALGFDLYSEPTRREVIEKARATGRLTMSGRIKLVDQRPGGEIKNGFIKVVPVFKGHHDGPDSHDSRGMSGFIVSPVHISVWLTHLLEFSNNELGLALFDGERENPSELLHDSSGFGPDAWKQAKFSIVEKFQSGDRWLTARIFSLPALETHVFRLDSWLVLMFCVTLSILLTIFVFAFVGRQSALNELALSTRNMQLLSRAIDNSASIVVITDVNGVIEYVNSAFCKITGYSSEEAIGQNPRILKSGVQNNEFYQELWKTILSGKPWSGRFCNRRKTGSEYWESAQITPVADPDGKISHFIAVKEDISESLMTQKILEQAKAAAESASIAKGQFLANMSHEIRTPMNAVIGYAHLAKKSGSIEKVGEYLAKILSAGNNVLDLINDILDFSKIEAGKLDLEATSFVLDEVMSDLANIVSANVSGKDIYFFFQIPPEVPENLIGDPTRLGQILTNLVSNAFKFTERGEIEVRVSMLEKINTQVKIEFSVRDTGIGLSEDQRKRIFEDFSQADGSTTRKYGGTGLGLSISRRLVTAMGGQLQVESTPGRGSRFFFSLWFGTNGRREEPLTEVFRGRRFVIADSRTLPWRGLMAHLELASAEVKIAAGGRELLEHLRRSDTSEPCDMVFIYARLQDYSGIELARLIKTDPDLKHKPAIVLVAHRDEFALLCADKTTRDSVADDILMAPITPSDMMNTVIGIFAPQLRKQSLKLVEEHDWKNHLKGVRVLMAEDNLINQEIALELLTQAGCEVKIAGDGCQAVEEIMAAEQPWDIVLMDVQMPHMDGLDATRLIRADGRFNHLPIVAMTAHAMNDARERCMNAGMNAHIVKPINPEDLFNTILRFCVPGKNIPDAVPLRTTDTAQFWNELPSIVGLDIESGLRRVMGNTQLYYKLLRRFVEEQANVAARIAGILDTGDKTRAAQLVHSIKGVAGNLGATELFAQAQLLERCIKESRSPEQTDSELLCFSDKLGSLIIALKNRLPAEEAVDQAKPGETIGVPSLLKTDLARFIGLLKESRLELIDCFKSLHDELKKFSDPEEFAAIEKAVRTGEFDQALAPLRSIAARLQIKIDD